MRRYVGEGRVFGPAVEGCRFHGRLCAGGERLRDGADAGGAGVTRLGDGQGLRVCAEAGRLKEALA
ncbi:putative protein OS=Streptomyces aurantiogriseus OX=66870 GN=GCM10010251_71530 PE=4 SV=1 [Streptomyces aurantiogriseus]|uniref:Uncharacterized protein n=1 Tax=Streptomyces aurantiogriseus TaxID=66870 RepID=A0A918FL57_9ACTN|nr:hypothetical protein GCM10010251_71530 [Streptomyces aurantiogriseus]